jgi:hypothetical protein
MRGDEASELASECAAVFGGATMRGVTGRAGARLGSSVWDALLVLPGDQRRWLMPYTQTTS